MTVLHNRAVALAVLVSAALISFGLLTVAEPGGAAAVSALVVITALVYVFPLAFLAGANYTKYFQPMWVRALLAIILAVLAAISGAWASSVLNQAFYVPSANFPLSQAVLTFAFLPVKGLGPIIDVAFALFVAAAPLLLVASLLAGPGWRPTAKIWGLVIGGALYFGFLMGTAGFLNRNEISIATRLALALDFDRHHRCTGISSGTLVRLVGDGNVLVHTRRAQSAAEPAVLLPCQPVHGLSPAG